MLQSHQIKKESLASRVIADSTKCTCKKTACEENCNPNSHPQVLVSFGLNRKIVLTLNGKNTLHELFTSYVLSEPVFSGLLKDSYVVFQEFNQKFGAWVDIHPKETLRDGVVLKAVFFPLEIERDESSPYSIRQKQKELEIIGQNCVKRHRPSEIVPIEDGVDVTNNAENKYSSKENDGTVNRKKKRSKKIETEPVNQKVNKDVPKIKRPRMTQEQNNGKLSNKPKDHAQQVKITNLPPYNLDKSEPANSLQVSDSRPKCIGFQQRIQWTNNIQKPAQRKAWAKKNAKRMWHHTLFSGVGQFVWKENCIEYVDDNKVFEHRMLFWGCCSLVGPIIIVPLGISFKTRRLRRVLRYSLINTVKNHYGKARVTLQFLNSLHTQGKMVKTILQDNSIDFCKWPCYVRDISPLEHAWKLVGEKVKNIPCSSKQEMISIVSEVWKNDLDVQLLCIQFITYLPEILKSVIQQNGYCPKIVLPGTL